MNALMEALGKAQSEIKGVAMDGFNPYYSSRYTTLKLILETIKPILRKHGLVLTQLSVGENGEVGVETTLSHPESMESLTSKVIVPVEGKNLAQEAGKNITYLRRYAIASMFNIYSDEDIDANSPAQQVKETVDIEAIIEEHWKPMAAMADELKIEFEPLPPDITEEGLRKRYAELKKKVEGAK